MTGNGLSPYNILCQAEMTELADVQDLGSCAARREGSSPFFRILYVEGKACELSQEFALGVIPILPLLALPYPPYKNSCLQSLREWL